MNETAWVAVSFIIFLALAFRPLWKMITGALDKRSSEIATELSEAVRLREEAQATLAAYQKKHREITEEAEEILRSARDNARAMQKQAKESLDQAIEKRVAAAEDKIAQEERRALQDVQNHVIELASQITQLEIVENMQDASDEKVIELALGDINRIVH